jgi:hypothetical protein
MCICATHAAAHAPHALHVHVHVDSYIYVTLCHTVQSIAVPATDLGLAILIPWILVAGLIWRYQAQPQGFSGAGEESVGAEVQVECRGGPKEKDFAGF